MERAILADSVTQEQVKYLSRGVAEFAVTAHDGRGLGLEVLADRFVGFSQERVSIRGLDPGELPFHW